MAKSMVKSSSRKNKKSRNYTPISKNIYHDGHSYRVRVRIDGETQSVSTSSKKKAYEMRNQLLSLKF